MFRYFFNHLAMCIKLVANNLDYLFSIHRKYFNTKRV